MGFRVIPKKKHAPPRVVNVRAESCTLYIGRPSMFGNPYGFEPRDRAIERYREDARKPGKLRDAIAKIPEGAKLGCYCKPLDCHGDVIVEVWLDIRAGRL